LPSQRDPPAARPEERAVLDRPAKKAPPEEFPQRYRIERVLAHGAFGAVFLAHDERVGEPVVLKQYAGLGKGQASQAFVREAKALGGLQHPHVIAVRDVFRAGNDAYLALEYAPEGSLADRLAREPTLPLDEALDITHQVLEGLAAAHAAGIVHRDVKPQNILFRRGEAKLADFGVALDPVLDRAVRAARWQAGTLAWMAPEQVRGEPATPATDVHAVGALLYRMLAGRHHLPLERLGEPAARRMVLEQAPALPLAGLPEEVNALLADALAKEPSARSPDAGALLRRLDRARRRGLHGAGPPRSEPAQPFGSAGG